MGEVFEKLANKYADAIARERVEQTKIKIIKNIMKNMKWSLEDVFNVLEIKGEEREIIAKQLQNYEFDKLMKNSQKWAKEVSMTEADISEAITSVRKKRKTY